MKWFFNIRQRQENHLDDMQASLPVIEKAGETLTPNMRALRLAMTASDLLLSMGVPASRVVSRTLDITETYCDRPVHVDVSSNLITLSQLRGIEKEPLTLIRPVTPLEINNMTLQLVQQLVYNIREGKYSLTEAEIELEKIIHAPITYPAWMITAANASIAGGVSLMFSSNWRIWLLTFVIAVMVDRLVVRLTKRGISPFFRQVAAATFVTLAAAGIHQLTQRNIAFFDGMNPNLIVVGGIIMLVAGLMIVGAIQDAIEEYYITANARILKVILLTMGIVVGILFGLYIAGKLGMGIYISPNPLSLNTIEYQVVGGAIAAAAYAIGTQTRLRAVIWAGIMGAAALLIMYSARHLDISIVPATGVAATVVGLIATVFSRRWRTPSTGIIAAGILPLVPGLALFNGLMQLVNHPPDDPLFNRGLATLFTAIASALAIAIGASLGSMLGRPLHHQITHNRNIQPFVAFMRYQLKAAPRYHLANFALTRSLSNLLNQNHKPRPKLTDKPKLD